MEHQIHGMPHTLPKTEKPQTGEGIFLESSTTKKYKKSEWNVRIWYLLVASGLDILIGVLYFD